MAIINTTKTKEELDAEKAAPTTTTTQVQQPQPTAVQPQQPLPPTEPVQPAPAPIQAAPAKPAPAPVQQPRRKATGFTNLNRIIEASRGGTGLGQAVASGIAGQTQQVQGGIQKAQQKFQEEAEKRAKELQEKGQQQQQLLSRFAAPQAAQSDAAQQPASPFAKLTQQDLKDIQAKRADYTKVLENLGAVNYAERLQQQQSALQSAQQALTNITSLARTFGGEKYKDASFAAQAAMQARQREVLDTLRTLQTQREAQHFVNQYKDEDITNRLAELETAAAQRGSVEGFMPEEELSKLTGLSNLQYTGPTGLDLDPEIGAQTQQLQQLGRLAGSAGGRQELLRRFVGGEGYTAGQRSLDQTLFGQEGLEAIRPVVGQANVLERELERGQRSAEARAEQLQSLAQGQSEKFKGDLATQREGMLSQLQNRLSEVQQQGTGLLGVPKQITDVLTSTEQKFATDPTLATPEQRLARGLEMAKAEGIITPDQAARLEGPGGLIARARQAGMPPAEINRLIAERIQSNIVPGQATIGGVATGEELARISALDRLMGKTGVDVGIPGATEAYTPGRTRLDVESLMAQIRNQEEQKLAQLTTPHSYSAWRRKKNIVYDPTAFNQWLATQSQYLASDKNNKKNIEYDPKALQRFMDRIKPSAYDYKDEVKDSPLASKNRELGVMAQDLEKSELGKEAVHDTEMGKIVDYDNLEPKMLASIAALNKRLKELENKK